MKRILFGRDFEVPAWLPGALTLLLLLPGITRSFWDRDEAQYAAIARDMEEAGHFFNPELFGRPYAEKPPLAIALTAVSFRWLGETELAGRLPHVLLFSGASVLLFLIGRRISDPRRAFFAAMMLPTSLLGLLCGRLVLTDSGGLQEESTFFRTPCLTLRPNTERPVTIDLGSNRLTSLPRLGLDIEHALSAAERTGSIPPLWDGKTAQRTLQEIAAASAR